MQPHPVGFDLRLVELRPCLNQPPLRTRDLTGDQIDWIDTEDRHVFLIERVKVWSMVWRPGLGEHPDHNSEEPADLWHSKGFEQVECPAGATESSVRL